MTTLSIVLPEDTVSQADDSIVRHGGDAVMGFLEVITISNLLFDVTITFEGLNMLYAFSDMNQLKST